MTFCKTDFKLTEAGQAFNFLFQLYNFEKVIDANCHGINGIGLTRALERLSQLPDDIESFNKSKKRR